MSHNGVVAMSGIVALIIAVVIGINVGSGQRGNSRGSFSKTGGYAVLKGESDLSDSPSAWAVENRSRRAQKVTNSGSGDLEAKLLDAIVCARSPSEIADARNDLLRYYAEFNPEAGVRWLCSLDPTENIGGLLRVFGSNVVRLKGGDWESLARMVPSEMRAEFAKGALIGIGQSDAKAAWLKLNEFSKEYGAPKDFAADVYQWIIKKNPEGARDLLDINVAPESARFFFDNAEFKDQQSAVRILAGIVDKGVLEECCIGYIRRVPSDDLEQFGSALISEFQPSADRDRWVVEVVRRIYPDNIKSAVPLIRQISDPQTRLEITRIIYGYADGIGGKFAQKTRELLPE